MIHNEEYIVAAAIQLKPEFVKEPSIYKDESIRTPEDPGDDIYKIEIGRSHADIYHRHGDRVLHTGVAEGFYTNFGRFVDRYEGYEIAEKCGQIDPRFTCDKRYRPNSKPRLFSEDIFWTDPNYPSK